MRLLGNDGGMHPQNKCALVCFQYSEPMPGNEIREECWHAALDLDVARLGRNSVVNRDLRVSIAPGCADNSILAAS